MILKDLLNEVKFGSEGFEKKKLFDDISEDFVEFDENIRQFKPSKRLNKLIKKFEKPEVEKISNGIKSISRKFEAVEEPMVHGELNEIQSRIVKEDIKRELRTVISFINKRENMRFLKSNDMLAEVAGIVSTVLFGLKLLGETHTPMLSENLQELVDENLITLTEAE